MREINRSRYLRGTKSWPIRNLFVFGTLAFTVLTGAAVIYLFPGITDLAERKTAEEKKLKLEKREKLRAIQLRREELGLDAKKSLEGTK